MDTNEKIYSRKIKIFLRRLLLRDDVELKTQNKCQSTLYWGGIQIDVIFVSTRVGILVSHFSPFLEGIRDHWVVVVDINFEYITDGNILGIYQKKYGN